MIKYYGRVTVSPKTKTLKNQQAKTCVPFTSFIKKLGHVCKLSTSTDKKVFSFSPSKDLIYTLCKPIYIIKFAYRLHMC